MPIPPEVLAVERPRNTVVVAYGKNKDRYAVRERVGCRYDKGRRLPVNGPTVGHIVDGAYVPAGAGPAPVSRSPVDLRAWAAPRLVEDAAADLLDGLREHFCAADAERIWAIAALRVAEPGIRDCELKAAYEESLLSELHPGAALSRNSVSKFLSDLGRSCSRIAAYMRSRAEAVRADHTLLVDGTRKSDDSRADTLSDLSFKSRGRGARSMLVMYAFDLEAMEPVCSKAFPGSMLDLTAYDSFIAENGIRRGLVVSDKGIPASAAEERFASNPDLHYMNPVKRNSKLTSAHSMLDWEGALPGFEGVLYKKGKASGRDKWLYAFRDAARAAKEEADWISRAARKGGYDLGETRRRQASFGTVVLESDLDMEPAAAYAAYASRWEIEVVMRYYKSALELDETRAHGDASVIGSEFCDFLATVITYRLIARFRGAGLLEKGTYGSTMKVLRRAKQARVGESGEWGLVKTAPAGMKVLAALGLVDAPEAAPKRKRGRPRKAAPQGSV